MAKSLAKLKKLLIYLFVSMQILPVTYAAHININNNTAFLSTGVGTSSSGAVASGSALSI